MKKRLKTRQLRRQLSALGEPAHVGKIYVGRNVNDPRNPKRILKRISEREIQHMADEVAAQTTMHPNGHR